MRNRGNSRLWWSGALLFVLAVLGSLWIEAPISAHPILTPLPLLAPQDPGLVGSAVCASCHGDHAGLVENTTHAANLPGAPGCEGCHGPGEAHVDAMFAGNVTAGRELIFSFDGSPLENAGRCLGCHETSRQVQQFDHSEHQLNGVACQNCHSPHLLEVLETTAQELGPPVAQSRFFSRSGAADREDRWLTDRLLRASQPDLCYSCHATIESKFALPTHHRVPEGLMKCTDCHNPHGTRNQPMLRSANWETCVNCHAEKRGPYIFEHASVKVEGCTTCHTPHGSVNRNLLVRREGRFLCLQCHVDPAKVPVDPAAPPAPNVPHGRFGFQTRGECIRCHVAIHGSNNNPDFLD